MIKKGFKFLLFGLFVSTQFCLAEGDDVLGDFAVESACPEDSQGPTGGAARLSPAEIQTILSGDDAVRSAGGSFFSPFKRFFAWVGQDAYRTAAFLAVASTVTIVTGVGFRRLASSVSSSSENKKKPTDQKSKTSPATASATATSSPSSTRTSPEVAPEGPKTPSVKNGAPRSCLRPVGNSGRPQRRVEFGMPPDDGADFEVSRSVEDYDSGSESEGSSGRGSPGLAPTTSASGGADPTTKERLRKLATSKPEQAAWIAGIESLSRQKQLLGAAERCLNRRQELTKALAEAEERASSEVAAPPSQTLYVVDSTLLEGPKPGELGGPPIVVVSTDPEAVPSKPLAQRVAGTGGQRWAEVLRDRADSYIPTEEQAREQVVQDLATLQSPVPSRAAPEAPTTPKRPFKTAVPKRVSEIGGFETWFEAERGREEDRLFNQHRLFLENQESALKAGPPRPTLASTLTLSQRYPLGKESIPTDREGGFRSDTALGGAIYQTLPAPTSTPSEPEPSSWTVGGVVTGAASSAYQAMPSWQAATDWCKGLFTGSTPTQAPKAPDAGAGEVYDDSDQSDVADG